MTPFPRSIAETDPEAIKVVGALVDGEMRPASKKRADTAAPMPIRPGVLIEDTEKDGWDSLEAISESAADDLPICFTRAYHHWLCAQQHGKEPVHSICKDCGREKWWEPKRESRTRKRPPNHRTQGGAASATTHQPLPTISQADKADMELVLDALSYARTGSWRSLRAMTAPIDDALWFAHETARRLEALGHIQLEVDEKCLLPKRWSIAPSTIVVPELGPCFLAGSRSARLVHAIAARGDYIDRRENVILLGPSGVGKTHIALALGLAACQKGLGVRFATASQLVHELIEARDEKRLLRLQAQLAKVSLLIVDELGYVPLSQTGSELLFDVFSRRYENGATIVTSNLPFQEWTSVFASERLTGALLDRITHHVHILEMNAESYRLKQSRSRRRPSE